MPTRNCLHKKHMVHKAQPFAATSYRGNSSELLAGWHISFVKNDNNKKTRNIKELQTISIL
jgi:hypothetical protein